MAGDGDGGQAVHFRTKRRHNDPKRSALDDQRAQLELLLRKPHAQPNTISTSAGPDGAAGHRARVERAAPREVLQTTSSATSGAGSGEFHVYRASRRREQSRLAEMDSVTHAEQADLAHEAKRRRQHDADAERTAKKQAKRRARQAHRRAVKGNIPGAVLATHTAADAHRSAAHDKSSSDEEEDNIGPAAVKKPRQGDHSDGNTDDDETELDLRDHVRIVSDDDD